MYTKCKCRYYLENDNILIINSKINKKKMIFDVSIEIKSANGTFLAKKSLKRRAIELDCASKSIKWIETALLDNKKNFKLIGEPIIK